MVSADRRTVIQILGSLMNRPSLLSDVDKYQIEPNEFNLSLDRYVFTAIYNLYAGGAEIIHAVDIDTYLQSNELAKKILEESNGLSFIQDCETYGEPENFPYYYNKFKKFGLLRELQKAGVNIDHIYCEDSINPKADEINEKFEHLKPSDIINMLKGEVATLENKFSSSNLVEESTAFDGVKSLLEELKVKPECGVRLQGDIFNTVTRGGRLGKLYLRSASSGVGKTRSMVGDACNIAYPIRYEVSQQRWVSTGEPQKILYVMTEQDTDEIQTMILAYLTGINEEAFIYGTFASNPEYLDRIEKALNIMERYKDNFLQARIPDPCSSVVKNLFRRYNFQKGIEYFFYDYIFSSPAMLNEYRDLAIREDVALRMFTTCLKNLAVELNAFILTSTQLSNLDDDKGGFKDYRNIQGSRAIVNLVDFACIMSRPTQEELKMIEGVTNYYGITPNLITDVFKNRRGRWTNIRIWSNNDLGTMRKLDLFATSPSYNELEDFQVVEFTLSKSDELRELEDLYNDGVVPDSEVEKLLNTVEESEIQPKTIVESVREAFGNEQERRKRVHESKFGDYL